MKNLTIPHNESERIKGLMSYQIVDSLPDNAFDEITQIPPQSHGYWQTESYVLYPQTKKNVWMSEPISICRNLRD